MATVYGDIDAQNVVHSAAADALFEELQRFLSEWLTFEPGEYDAADLYAAASVMAERLSMPVTTRAARKWVMKQLGSGGGSSPKMPAGGSRTGVVSY